MGSTSLSLLKDFSFLAGAVLGVWFWFGGFKLFSIFLF